MLDAINFGTGLQPIAEPSNADTSHAEGMMPVASLTATAVHHGVRKL
jgi:hypothetical protein